MVPERATVAKTAELLGLSSYAVRRIAKAFEKGGAAEVEGLRWGRGRPTKNVFLEQHEIDFMVSRTTLNHQVGMSLQARALQFSQRFKRPISRDLLRSFYAGRGVTFQLPQVRLGPKTLDPPEAQMARVERQQQEVAEARKEGRELICIDESIFSSKGAKRPLWAPIGRAVEWNTRWSSDKYVAVCAATSETRGLVHYNMLHG